MAGRDYVEAARAWLHGEAEVIDTANITSAEVAAKIADAVSN